MKSRVNRAWCMHSGGGCTDVPMGPVLDRLDGALCLEDRSVLMMMVPNGMCETVGEGSGCSEDGCSAKDVAGMPLTSAKPSDLDECSAAQVYFMAFRVWVKPNLFAGKIERRHPSDGIVFDVRAHSGPKLGAMCVVRWGVPEVQCGTSDTSYWAFAWVGDPAPADGGALYVTGGGRPTAESQELSDSTAAVECAMLLGCMTFEVKSYGGAGPEMTPDAHEHKGPVHDDSRVKHARWWGERVGGNGAAEWTSGLESMEKPVTRCAVGGGCSFSVCLVRAVAAMGGVGMANGAVAQKGDWSTAVDEVVAVAVGVVEAAARAQLLNETMELRKGRDERRR